MVSTSANASQVSFTGRMARFTARHAWLTLGAWALLLVGAFLLSGSLNVSGEGGVESTDATRASALIEAVSGEEPRAEEFVLVEATELGLAWEEQVLSIISARDEIEVVQARRRQVQERLRRLAKTYVDGVYDDNEYKRQKRTLETELESLIMPEADAAADAGKLIERLPELWCGANMDERRKLLLAMLDAVYVDAKHARSIVAIRPKAPFRPIFHLATTRAGSGVTLTPGPDRQRHEPSGRVIEAVFS